MLAENWKLQTCIGLPVRIEYKKGKPVASLAARRGYETTDDLKHPLNVGYLRLACETLGPCEWVYTGTAEVINL